MRILVVAALAGALAPCAVSQNKVTDADTAVKAAEKALVRVYGKKKIESERPFTATLDKGVWTVAGTLHCKDENGQSTTTCVGGVATAKVSEVDGRVLSVFHTK